MNCPSCGNATSEKDPTCPHCGATLAQDRAPAVQAIDPGQAALPPAESAVEKSASQAEPFQPAPPQSAAISLRRPPQLTAALTRFDVYIDGKKVGRLHNNDRQRFEIPPGIHTLYLKLDDFKSKTLSIDLQPGQTLRLLCTVKAFGLGITIGFE